jgi:predicted amidohydrolase
MGEPSSESLRIAAVSFRPEEEPRHNLGRICTTTRECLRDGAGLIVFPECAVQGYPLGLGKPNLSQYEHHARFAEPIPGPVTEALQAALAGSGAVVAVGMTEQPDERAREAGRLYNAIALVAADGVIARYRKIHTGGVEKCLWNRGNRWVVADSRAGRLGLLICYDLVFPEAARSLALAGAEILVLSTAWANAVEETFARGYDLFTRSRALENQLFLVSANLVDGPGVGFYGHSRIVDPTGHVLAEAVGEGVACAIISLRQDLIRFRARSWFGQVFLRDREPATYATD